MRAAYPTHPWVHARFFKQQRARLHTPQTFMLRILKTIFALPPSNLPSSSSPTSSPASFPRVTFQTNVRAGHGLKLEKFPLEIDVYIPELKIGFEYQVSLLLLFFFVSSISYKRIGSPPLYRLTTIQFAHSPGVSLCVSSLSLVLRFDKVNIAREGPKETRTSRSAGHHPHSRTVLVGLGSG